MATDSSNPTQSADPAPTPTTADWWWTVVAANLAAFVAVFVLNEGLLAVPPVLAEVRIPAGLVVLTAPATVALAVHLDRTYLATVSDWEPRSEYVLLGLAMWAGVGVPLAALYLARRRKYVGTP